MYPTTMLNVAVNYREHDIEMARVRPAAPQSRQPAPTAGGRLPGTQSAPGIWERAGGRHPLESVHVPEERRRDRGRRRERAHAAGAHADRVGMRARRRDRQAREPCDAAQALDYVFGYTLENDMSDRGGRGDTRFGSDWLITKNHDTFAPLGPFITPKEFIKDVGNTGDEVLAERRGSAGGHARRR